MSDDGEVALWRQASSDLLALVVDAELTEMLGYRLERELALEALAARAELADRMCRHRWLAMEAARRAWAAWEEIDLTVGLPPGVRAGARSPKGPRTGGRQPDRPRPRRPVNPLTTAAGDRRQRPCPFAASPAPANAHSPTTSLASTSPAAIIATKHPSCTSTPARLLHPNPGRHLCTEGAVGPRTEVDRR